MCKGPSSKSSSSSKMSSSSSKKSNSPLFLFSLESFGDKLPSIASLIVTGSIMISFLWGVERSLRVFFTSIKDYHPILEDETNRNILARHIGVDAFSCFVVATLGWKAKYIVQDLIDQTLWGKKGSMPLACEPQMFTYRPESQRITLLFVAYQIKNFYDTIVWNDGIIFIIHHALTLMTSYGALLHGMGHYYVLFYFGVSEISTGVLCLLANFDDEHGVKGLADAFPTIKVVLGAIFAVLFVICRVFMWSTVSYYYCRDANNVLKLPPTNNNTGIIKIWWQFTYVSLSILSLLQIIWLVEIGRIGYEEGQKYMAL